MLKESLKFTNNFYMTELNLFPISFENVVCCEELCDELEGDEDNDDNEELEEFVEEDDEILCNSLSASLFSIIDDFTFLKSFDLVLDLEEIKPIYGLMGVLTFGIQCKKLLYTITNDIINTFI